MNGRISLAVAVLAALTVYAPLAAQIAVSIEPTVGIYYPTRDESDGTITNAQAEVIGSFAGRREGGLWLGLRAAAPIWASLGAEITASRASNRYSVTRVYDGGQPDLEEGPNWHIDALSFRVYSDLGTSDRRIQTRIKAGPSALRIAPGNATSTRWGASVGASVSTAVRQGVQLALGVDSYLYSFGNIGPRQHDLAVSFGLRVDPAGW